MHSAHRNNDWKKRENTHPIPSTKAVFAMMPTLTCIVLPGILGKPATPVAVMKRLGRRRYDYVYERAQWDEDKGDDLNTTEYAYTDRYVYFQSKDVPMPNAKMLLFNT